MQRKGNEVVRNRYERNPLKTIHTFGLLTIPFIEAQRIEEPVIPGEALIVG